MNANAQIDLYVTKPLAHVPLDLEEVRINKNKSILLGFTPDLDEKSKRAFMRFCVLALYTYLVRKTKAATGESCDKVEITERMRPFLQQLWESKSKDLEWTRKTFGECPFNDSRPYLQTQGSRNNFQLWIPQNVKISVHPATDKSAFDDNDIRQLIYGHLGAPVQDPKKLSITVQSQDHLISSDKCNSSLHRNAEFRLYVTWNFEANLAVFWIDSKNRVHALYPEFSLPFVEHPHDISRSDEQTTLQIPKFKELRVNTPPGTETCLVISLHARFSKNDSEMTRQVIESSLSDRAIGSPPETPDFREFPLPRRQLLRRRLEVAEVAQSWMNEIVQNLQGFGDKVYFFNIPNR